MPKFLKICLKTMGYFISLLLTYGILMTCATFLPSQISKYKLTNDEPAIDIYVISNGVHTDFVLPTVSSQMNWTSVFDPSPKTAWRITG
ncbi:DUF2459 domain-containing protein [Moraxella bovis]|uniref:DUF2459 domain-containing protein n=1 Tax=Moraxella bovis TaxID=476 RepID=UPI0022267228|nr:DUF2459 domain-containing protein [Moraxella bovis]